MYYFCLYSGFQLYSAQTYDNEIRAFATNPVCWGNFIEARNLGFGNTCNNIAPLAKHGKCLPFDIQNGDCDCVGSEFVCIFFHWYSPHIHGTYIFLNLEITAVNSGSTTPAPPSARDIFLVGIHKINPVRKTLDVDWAVKVKSWSHYKRLRDYLVKERKFNLIPMDKTTVYGVNSQEEVNVYLVDIGLPNKVLIPGVVVMECNLNSPGIDILIGMDII